MIYVVGMVIIGFLLTAYLGYDLWKFRLYHPQDRQITEIK